MKRRRYIWLGAVLAVALVAAGCTSKTAMVGPKPPPGYTTQGRASGDACGFLVLGIFPTSNFQRRTQIAYDRAVESGGGTALTDTSLRHRWFAIPFAGIRHCTRLEGKVVR